VAGFVTSASLASGLRYGVPLIQLVMVVLVLMMFDSR
jgi:hypothetical protein